MIIRKLKSEDIPVISNAFQEQGWNKPVSQYERYYQENRSNKRVTLVAFIDNEFAGYGNIEFESSYDEFKQQGIPEITDVNTLIKFRGQGVATRLMDALEEMVFQNYSEVGIGVGLTENYGSAQRLYVKRGYVPNGKGIYHGKNKVEYYKEVIADDDLVLYLSKKR